MTTPDLVVVCGMPSSGNRLLHQLVLHHGLASSIRHYGGFGREADQWERDRLNVALLWPYREPGPHRRSMLRHDWFGKDPELAKLAERGDPFLLAQRWHYYATAARAAEHLLPILPVSYSMVVRSPNRVGRAIASWLGVEYLGWPTVVIDGDAKYLAGNGEPTEDEAAAAREVYSIC